MGEDTTVVWVLLFLVAFAVTLVALDSQWWQTRRTRRYAEALPPDPRYTIKLVPPETTTPTASAPDQDDPTRPGA